MSPSPVPKRIKEARKAVGLTQERLGILAQIDEESASARMNQYERGKHEPDFSMISRIAAVVNLPTAYFYAESDEVAYLLSKFHRLAPERKATILAMLGEFSGTSES